MSNEVAEGSPKTIAYLRKILGLSQVELANELGTDKRVISHWETGHNKPQPKYLRLIIDFFKSRGIDEKLIMIVIDNTLGVK